MALERHCDRDDNAINLIAVELREGTLYFKDDLESDVFTKCEDSKDSVLRNQKHQVLMMTSEDTAVFETMTQVEIEGNAPQTKFVIQTYKESTPRGYAVAIMVRNKNETYILSCQGKALKFQKGTFPPCIDSDVSDLIFYQKKVKGHEKMQFESSLYQKCFLACEKESKSGHFKLVLKEVCQEEDGVTLFTVKNFLEKKDIKPL
uniref:Interleukin-18-like n=1 Tax=Monodelphis domestica TaxID=13616 RepID=F7DJL0_MONDO